MTDNAKKQPLSYEPLKLILANMCMETREKIGLRVPSLQKTNKLVPYTFDSAYFRDEKNFEVDRKAYKKYLTGPFHCYIKFDRCDGKFHRHEGKSVEKDILELALRYIRDGTRIRKLVYYDLPKGLEQMNFKIYISELSMFQNGSYGINVKRRFEKLLPMIKDSIPLKKVEIEFNGATRSLFVEPLIKTCTNLFIVYYQDGNIEMGDLLHHLDNKNIFLQIRAAVRWTDHMGLDLVQNLARHWINTEKQVGSTFTLPHYDSMFINDVINDMKEQLGARITEISELGDDLFAHCAVIPMNDSSEMVVFGTRYDNGRRSEGTYNLKFALKMAIKTRGSTSVPGIFK